MSGNYLSLPREDTTADLSAEKKEVLAEHWRNLQAAVDDAQRQTDKTLLWMAGGALALSLSLLQNLLPGGYGYV
jgi:hypothetical protein